MICEKKAKRCGIIAFIQIVSSLSVFVTEVRSAQVPQQADAPVFQKHKVEDDPRCYLAEEVQQIVRATEGQYKVLFRLAAETGARARELYALTVGDSERHQYQ